MHFLVVSCLFTPTLAAVITSVNDRYQNENNSGSIEGSGANGIEDVFSDNSNGLDIAPLPPTNFIPTNQIQLGLGAIALLSAAVGLVGLVFRVPCLLRVTAGLYAVYLVILAVPVMYFAQTVLQAFFSGNVSEWAWFHILGLVLAMVFMAHGCLVMLRARREMMDPKKEKFEHLTREEQWW